jgi:hypothetical protein
LLGLNVLNDYAKANPQRTAVAGRISTTVADFHAPAFSGGHATNFPGPIPPRAGPIPTPKTDLNSITAARGLPDRFVIKQEDAKKVLSVALCDHYHHVRLARDGRIAQLPSKTSSSSVRRASATY